MTYIATLLIGFIFGIAIGHWWGFESGRSIRIIPLQPKRMGPRAMKPKPKDKPR